MEKKFSCHCSPTSLSPRHLLYGPQRKATRNTGFQFSGILLPHPLKLQATGFLELWILFELMLKWEICFESYYVSIFIPSVYGTYRWTLWFIIQLTKHRNLENPELWGLVGMGKCAEGEDSRNLPLEVYNFQIKSSSWQKFCVFFHYWDLNSGSHAF
jgi:hypothetical protein